MPVRSSFLTVSDRPPVNREASGTSPTADGQPRPTGPGTSASRGRGLGHAARGERAADGSAPGSAA